MEKRFLFTETLTNSQVCWMEVQKAHPPVNYRGLVLSLTKHSMYK